jgi:ribonucleoside-triphosphate reductase
MKIIPVECYSRVVGFFRPVSHWNKGKKEEFRERVEYSFKAALQSTLQAQAEADKKREIKREVVK